MTRIEDTVSLTCIEHT